jgi:hypothetical protein
MFLLVSASVRNAQQPMGGVGNVIEIQSVDNFCFFLPPKPGISIADSEGYPLATDTSKWAVSYCTRPMQNALGHQLFPKNTITGAHFASSPSSIQITGTFNASVMGIPLDGGGYYDLDNNVNSPPGGICYGYDSFYNAVNPIDGIYCVKCCKGIQGCGIQNGDKGCSFMGYQI